MKWVVPIMVSIALGGCPACAGSSPHHNRRIVFMQESDSSDQGVESTEVQRVLQRDQRESVGGELPQPSSRQIRRVDVTQHESPGESSRSAIEPSAEDREAVEGITNETFILPVDDPRVTSPFGIRNDPFHPSRHRMHRGTDFGGATGTAVYATASGVAIMAGFCDWGTGNCIVMVHPNGWRSQYFHLDEVHIRCGQKVRQGQHIGDIGSTGRSTGPHLHFQLSHQRRDVDPMTVIGTPLSVDGAD